MKKIFYFWKHLKINRASQKLSKIIEEFSTKSKDCQKSLKRLSTIWNNDEDLSIVLFSKSSLSLFSSAATHCIFCDVCDLFSLICFRRRLIQDKTQASFFLAVCNWICSFSYAWFKISNEIGTQRQPQQIHSTYFFLIFHHDTVFFSETTILAKRRTDNFTKKNKFR